MEFNLFKEDVILRPENSLGNLEVHLFWVKSIQKSLQGLGTYWAASSRNQLILKSPIVIFHDKEEKKQL